MRIEDRDLVSRLPLLSGLADETREQLCIGAFLQLFPPSTDLIQQGQPADFLHVIVDGSIELFSSYRNRETTVSVVGPGDCFIPAAVVLDRPYLKSARTLTPSRVLLLPSENVRAAFRADAEFARRLTCELALGYRALVKELNNQKLRSNLERLANWILRQDGETGMTGTVTLPFEKKVLAARLGMSPEILSRSFANLVPYKVKVDGRIIRIGSRKDLEGLAQPSPLIDSSER